MTPFRKARKVLPLLLLLACTIFPAPAAASDRITSGYDERTGITHVRVWDLPEDARGGPTKQAEFATVKAFEKKYPKIKLHRATGLDLKDFGNKRDIGPLMAISGGIAPDILYVNFRSSSSFIQNQFLYPLDEYMEAYKKEVGEKEFNFRINEKILPVIRRKGTDLDGKARKKYWMMPDTLLLIAMAYRVDLFKRYGLDPDNPPKNWKELEEAAKKLTNKKDGTYGLLLTGEAYNFMNFLSCTGTKVISEDPKEEGIWHASFATKPAADALYFYKELYCGRRPDGGRGYATKQKQPYKEGRVAITFRYMTFRDVEGTGLPQPEQWRFAPVPSSPHASSSAEINSTMWGIFRGQKDKRVRDAAWKWLEFRNGKEARKILVDTLIKNNAVTAVHPAMLEDLGPEYEKWKSFINMDMANLFEDLAKVATPEPYGKNCQHVYKYLNFPVQDAISWEREGKFLDENGKPMPREQQVEKIYQMMLQYQDKCERQMIGTVDPATKSFRQWVSLGVCLLIVIVFGLVFYKVIKTFTPEHERGKGWQVKKYWIPYLLVLPAAASIALWQYYPMVRGAMMAFEDYHISTQSSDFTGMENFSEVLFDVDFWWSMVFSFYYATLVVLFNWMPPVLLAILLSEIKIGTVFFRIVFYLPALVSGLIIMFMWKTFFDPSADGLFNQILIAIGAVSEADPIGWVESKTWAMLCIVMPIGWAHMGPGCLIYLAALKGIPDDLYEAADVDGASYWQKVKHIVIPTLKPLLIINLIGIVIHAFNAANNVMAMTGGGPSGSTDVLGLNIFRTAFVFTEYGKATAMAWLMGLMLIGFTVHQLRILSRLEFKTTGDKK